MKKIVTDCDGVLLDWAFAFDVWMREQGYFRLPNTDHHFSQAKRYGIPEDEALSLVHDFNQTGALGHNNRTQYSSPVQVPGTTWTALGGGNVTSGLKQS